MLLMNHYFLRLAICLLIAFSSISAESQSAELKKISGYVTNKYMPLENVNVSVKGKNQSTVTNSKGFYSIPASEKEILQFTFVGMDPKEIMVEDVTVFLNVEMNKVLNELDEVFLVGKEKSSTADAEVKRRSKIKTAYGTMNLRGSGGRVTVLESEDLSKTAINVVEAMQGRIPMSRVSRDRTTGLVSLQLRPSTSLSNPAYAIWDVDGMIFDNVPDHIIPSDIDYMAVFYSPALSYLYGSRARGGVIVIRTKWATANEESIEKNKIVNQFKYKHDAFSYENLSTSLEYISEMENTPIDELYATYQKLKLSHKHQLDFYLDIFNFIRVDKKQPHLATKVLEDMENVFSQNPEALKALAYTYDSIGEKEKAAKVYYNIAYMRSSYAQSFRDLANAYVSNEQYEEAWSMYLNYLRRGFELKDLDIGQIVLNEMQDLHKRNKNIKVNEEKISFDDNLVTAQSDIRVVFEWNTSEAEFSLELVDPDLDVFTHHNSISKNKDLILEQKTIGYSSKEIFIDKIEKGKWIFNLTYLGNKKYDSTYLKATIFRNWGKENQTKEVKVFKLSIPNYKINLFEINYYPLSVVSLN